MGHWVSLPCGNPERKRAETLPIPTTNVGDIWNRQYELSEPSRALLAASRAGDRFLVEKYLTTLGKPNCCNSAGLTPLHAAVELGRADIVRLLLKHDADTYAPPGPNFDGPPIALASHKGYLEVVEVLLAAHAKPESLSNPYQSTCVHRAAAEGHASCVRALVSAHYLTAKVRNLGGPHRSIVDTHLLIANFQDANEQLALHRASAPGHFDCVEMLIHEGYSLLDEPDFDGSAALHLGVLTLEEKHAAKIARIILEARGDVNLRNAQQCTALHLVASGGRAQVVLVLLHHAADVTVTEVLRGRTPLHLAASAGARDVCIQLLEAHADVKAGSREAAGTPLTCAAPSCLEVLSAAMQRREYGTYYWRRDMLAN